MKLDKFTDYALRVLMTLSVRAPARVSVSEIASTYSLSENHLAKVAAELTRAGFTNSERGRGGGLTLARAAEDIRIGTVVRAMTRGGADVAECFGANQSCLILSACGLRGPLAEAQEAFFAALERYTLADVTEQKSALAELLSTS